MRSVLTILILLSGVCACGQKGPLFLPEPPDEQRTPEPPLVLDTDDPEIDEDVDETEDLP